MQPRKFYNYVWLFIGVFIGYILLAKFLTQGHSEYTVCPSRLLFGLPCPGCGLTRSVFALSHGLLLDAIWFNPNVLLAVPCAIVALMLLTVDICFKKSTLYSFWNWIGSHLHGWQLAVFIVIEIAIIILAMFRDGIGWPWL